MEEKRKKKEEDSLKGLEAHEENKENVKGKMEEHVKEKLKWRERKLISDLPPLMGFLVCGYNNHRNQKA